ERKGTLHAVRELIPLTGQLVTYRLPEQAALFESESSTKSDALTVVQYGDSVAPPGNLVLPSGTSAFIFWFWYARQKQVVLRLSNETGALLNWKVAYADPRYVLNQFHNLFAQTFPGIDDDVSEKWVEYSHLQGLFPIYNDPSINSIAVIRPRIDFSP